MEMQKKSSTSHIPFGYLFGKYFLEIEHSETATLKGKQLKLFVANDKIRTFK